MVGSIDPRCETVRGTHWPKPGRVVDWNSRRGNHLGQRFKPTASTGRTYGCKRSDLTQKTLVPRGPSTYGSRRSPGRREILSAPLRCALYHRLLRRPPRGAEVMRGIDQRDMGQRLREIAGLTSDAGIEFLRQKSEIVGDRDHAVKQRLRLGDIAGQHMGVGEPQATGDEGAFDLLPFIPACTSIVA